MFGASYQISVERSEGRLVLEVRSIVTVFDALLMAGGAVGLVFAIVERSLGLGAFCLISTATIAFYALREIRERIEVSDAGIKTNSLDIPWQRILAIDFEVGGEDEPNYLAIRTTWGPAYLFPNITSDESYEIFSPIYREFYRFFPPYPGRSR